MPTNLTYKGSIISTVNKNQSKTMKTQGKYLEGDVIVTNVTNDEAKSVSFTPSSSSQTQTITPGSGYESLSSVTVTVNPIPSSYIIPAGTITITTNGTHTVSSYADAFVNVVAPSPVLQDKNFIPSETSTTITADSGYNGLSSVTVAGITPTYIGSSVPQYTPETDIDFQDVDLNLEGLSIPAGYYSAGDITVPNARIYNSISVSETGLITSNNLVRASGNAAIGAITTGTRLYTLQMPTISTTTFTPSTVAQTVPIPQGGAFACYPITVEPIPSEYVIPAGTITLTTNTTAVDITQYAYADVNVTAPTPQLQHKTFQPSETSTTITCDSGYDGLARVLVYGITSTYVGSGVTRRSSSDMYDTEGRSSYIITAPSGYYATDGLYNISKMDGQTVTPTTSQQTIQTASKYLLGNITISAIPSQYIVPSGTYTISSVDSTTTFNVTQYANAQVTITDADNIAY